MLDGTGLALLRGTDEVVVGDLELAPEVLEGRYQRVAPGLRRHVVGGGGLGDLLAVLVEAGEELDVVAHRAAEARLDVGQDRGVGRAEVRGGVHVIDGRGDVERGLVCHVRNLFWDGAGTPGMQSAASRAGE